MMGWLATPLGGALELGSLGTVAAGSFGVATSLAAVASGVAHPGTWLSRGVHHRRGSREASRAFLFTFSVFIECSIFHNALDHH